MIRTAPAGIFRFFRMSYGRWLLIFTVLLISACSGLGGEPVIVATMIPPTPLPPTPTTIQQVADQGFPAAPPDLANGAQLYAEHCTRCHGINGEGDGELVLSDEVGNPGNFHDWETVSEIFPIDWFETVTEGRIDKLMPPWRDALTEQERWDVTMYVYTMRYSAEQFTTGRELYQQCVECHGERGLGDGPKAEEGLDVADLTNQESLTTRDDSAMYNIVAFGQSEVMPEFADQWSREQIWSAVVYARSLSLANAEQVIGQQIETESAAVSTADATPQIPPISAVRSTTLDVTGTVTNGTAGGTVEPGLTVELKVFSGSTGELVSDLERETTLNPDNTFVFEDVQIDSDKYYLTAIQHAGRDFASGFVLGNPSQESLELPITIYEITDDPSVVTISGSVSQINVVGNNLEITQILQLQNTSDQVFTRPTPDESGRYPWLVANLPPGSLLLGSEDPNRFIFSETEGAVFDTQPLMPGEERIIPITYLVSYGGGAVIEYETPYKIDGQLRLLVRPLSIKAESELLPEAGEEQVGQFTFNGYGQRLTMNAGDVIRYELSGQVEETTAPGSPAVVTSDNLIGILIGGGMVLVGGAVLIYVLSRKSNPQATSKTPNKAQVDRLVKQIAELDAQHEAGQINHDLWHKKRGELKAQLAQLMDPNTQDAR